jgi:hypothetical protein
VPRLISALLVSGKQVGQLGRRKLLNFLFELAIVLPVVRLLGLSPAGVLLHEVTKFTS